MTKCERLIKDVEDMKAILNGENIAGAMSDESVSRVGVPLLTIFYRQAAETLSKKDLKQFAEYLKRENNMKESVDEILIMLTMTKLIKKGGE